MLLLWFMVGLGILNPGPYSLRQESLLQNYSAVSPHFNGPQWWASLEPVTWYTQNVWCPLIAVLGSKVVTPTSLVGQTAEILMRKTGFFCTFKIPACSSLPAAQQPVPLFISTYTLVLLRRVEGDSVRDVASLSVATWVRGIWL